MLQNTLILKMLRQLTTQSLFTDIRPPTKRVLKSSIILSYMVVIPESCIEKMAHFSIGYLPTQMHLIFRGALIKYGTQSVYIKVSCCYSLFRTCSSKLQIQIIVHHERCLKVSIKNQVVVNRPVFNHLFLLGSDIRIRRLTIFCCCCASKLRQPTPTSAPLMSSNVVYDVLPSNCF